MTCGTVFQQDQIKKLLDGIKTKPSPQQLQVDTNDPKKVIVISGPTASGKSELGLMLAKQLGGEIISADSMQVYRGMDVGTAKVTLKEQAGVPHHLIDVCEVGDPFTVVNFFHAARQCICEIRARRKVPIVVGGTGFYLRALLYGPPSGPASIPQLRQALEKEMENMGPEVLYDHLKQLDPEYSKKITCNDKQKIVRALEIITLSGGPVSALPWARREKPLDYDYRCWFVYRPREILYQRIEERCDYMVEQGLIDEVSKLDAMGLRDNQTASQAIGYRQTLQYLDSEKTDEDFKLYIKNFKTASRRYAKRQFTWFKKEKEFRWLNIDVHDLEIAADFIMQDFKV